MGRPRLYRTPEERKKLRALARKKLRQERNEQGICVLCGREVASIETSIVAPIGARHVIKTVPTVYCKWHFFKRNGKNESI